MGYMRSEAKRAMLMIPATGFAVTPYITTLLRSMAALNVTAVQDSLGERQRIPPHACVPVGQFIQHIGPVPT